MKVVLQRVSEAKVTVEEKVVASIHTGLLVFVGIVSDDSMEDVQWLTNKIINLRIFSDSENLMNLSLKDIDGEILVVSQFTLHALTKKGNRPSYIRAARPEMAVPIYESFLQNLENYFGKNIKSGRFGADMKVFLVNDGPVTIIMDSTNKE